MKRAVVLLSGGLDSATALAMTRADGYECFALSFDYGQRHRVELKRADEQAALQGAVHRTAKVDLAAFGGSALTDAIDVPKDRDESQMGGDIPITYVPARNTVFLSFALAWSEVLGAEAIVIGANAIDYSGYPDCRPEFLAAYETMANLATKAGVEGHGVRILAPLLTLTKAEIIRRGLELSVDYGKTSSCYDPSPEGVPCGHCDSCLLRAKGFAEVGAEDPLTVAYGR